MPARIFSTLLLWAITAFILYFAGDFGWLAIIALLSAAALVELCAIFEKMGTAPLRITLQICNIAIFASMVILPSCGIANETCAGSLAFALCAVYIAVHSLKDPFSDYPVKTIIPTLFALLIPFALQWLAFFCKLDIDTTLSYQGMAVGVTILAAAKFSDVGGYVIGRAFGRHKLSPQISPNKSIEGAIGGIISSACIAAGLTWAFADFATDNVPMAAIMGAFIGALAIVSDLLESLLKRRAGVKDSGAVIPGIGGALDLADSLILTAPVGVILFSIIL